MPKEAAQKIAQAWSEESRRQAANVWDSKSPTPWRTKHERLQNARKIIATTSMEGIIWMQHMSPAESGQTTGDETQVTFV